MPPPVGNEPEPYPRITLTDIRNPPPGTTLAAVIARLECSLRDGGEPVSRFQSAL